MFFSADCSPWTDASFAPIFRVCSQKIKILWLKIWVAEYFFFAECFINSVSSSVLSSMLRLEGVGRWCPKEPRGVAPKNWKITPVLVLSGYKLLLKARARRSPDLTGTGTSVYTQLYRYRYYRSNDRQPSRTIRRVREGGVTKSTGIRFKNVIFETFYG